MYSENLVIKLNTIAHNYRNQVNRSLNAVLNQPKYKASGLGLASLHVDVIDGDANKSPVITIDIDQHMIYLGSRKLEWTKLPDVRNMMQWGKIKSGTFTKVPGYKDGARVAPEIAAKRVVFAIAVDKKKNDTHRPKKWRGKGLSAVMKEMNREIKAAFERAIEEDLQHTIDNEIR